MNYPIKNAIVIGVGGVANFCAVELKKRGVSVSFIESRLGTVGTSEAICTKNGIPYSCMEKAELTQRLLAIADETLIVSASNRYLFPKEVLEKENLTVINYHGALLPKFPGRNAEAWAIFEQESCGGITWHRVIADVDAGDVLVQKSIPLTAKMTSFLLLREYAKLAQVGFKEIVDGVLAGTLSGTKQTGPRDKIRYSWMKPNDGFFSMNWSLDKMSAFLRSMDYGPLQTLGDAQISIGGVDMRIVSYSTSEQGHLDEAESVLLIRRCGLTIGLRIENNDEKAP